MAQRRDLDDDFSQAVVQVFTESLLGDEHLQVLVGGTHHPHVYRNLLPATNPLDLALLQKTQQFGLQRVRQIADFVQHQGAAVGGLDLADGGFCGAGEGAFFMAEELTLQQRLGDGRAIDGDKLARALGCLMQPVGQHLLAGATFAQQQHGGVAARHLLDHAAGAQHFGVARDHAAQGVRLMQRLQAPVFTLQLKQPESTVYRETQQFGLERFGKKIIGPKRDGAQGVGLVVLACQHDDLDARVDLQQLCQQPETLAHRIRVRRQAEIHRDHGRLMPAELHQRRFTVTGGDTFKPVECPFDLLLQRQIIFDDQQRGRLGPAHAAPCARRSVPVRTSNNGITSVTTEPCPTSLFTSMLPPSSLMY